MDLYHWYRHFGFLVKQDNRGYLTALPPTPLLSYCTFCHKLLFKLQHPRNYHREPNRTPRRFHSTMPFLSRTTTSAQQSFEITPEYCEAQRDLERACRVNTGMTPRPWQTRATLALLYKHNVMLISATGSGKSMAYQSLPLLKGGVVLVIAPLNQLMNQQAERMETWGIKAVALTQAVLQDTQVYPKVAAGHYQIVFASPECTLARDGPLWSLLTKKDSFIKKLLYVAVDEVHLVLDWGQSFRPEYANLPALRPYLDRHKIPIIGMTATANIEKLKSLCRILQFDDEKSILIRETTNRPNIFYAVKSITSGESTSYVSS
jgi:superfamily II DNA or RNA helicase